MLILFYILAPLSVYLIHYTSAQLRKVNSISILQKNIKVLRGLVSSLLHMHPNEIVSISIENPIELGESVDDKELILDIRIRLNNQTLIHLEMQVANYHDWTDRSLLYLCRTYDQLKKGEKYRNILPSVHIGFLDFPVFPEYPEFYATYKLLNTKIIICIVTSSSFMW